MQIIRTYSAGVFMGDLDPKSRSKDGKRGIINNARRLWYWAGAASLSQLAIDGTSKPDECKFPVSVKSIEVIEIIEVLEMTKKAETNLKAVPIWKM